MSIARTSSQPWELLPMQSGVIFAQKDRVFMHALSYIHFINGSGLAFRLTFCSTGTVTREKQFGHRDYIGRECMGLAGWQLDPDGTTHGEF